jgi:hypothetical protein
MEQDPSHALTSSPWARRWVDFLYFSTITQSTVGYGDILPNSTSVRGVVMFQCILSLGLVSFVIAVIAGGTDEGSKVTPGSASVHVTVEGDGANS